MLRSQYKGVQRAMGHIYAKLKDRDDKRVVILSEGWFKGVVPKMLLKDDPFVVECVVGIGIIPVALTSVVSFIPERKP